jgi:hypothetical protein
MSEIGLGAKPNEFPCRSNHSTLHAQGEDNDRRLGCSRGGELMSGVRSQVVVQAWESDEPWMLCFDTREAPFWDFLSVEAYPARTKN